MKLENNVIQFYKEPVLSVSNQEQLPAPLVTMKIPGGQQLVYIVFSPDSDENNPTRWRGNLLNAGDWKKGCSMKVFNACNETIGITAGNKRIQLSQGKSVDFQADDWK